MEDAFVENILKLEKTLITLSISFWITRNNSFISCNLTACRKTTTPFGCNCCPVTWKRELMFNTVLNSVNLPRFYYEPSSSNVSRRSEEDGT